jgi:hypothetical protein
MKKSIIAVLAAGVWISVSEFVRNELVFKFLWIEHFRAMGLDFPSAMINNMIWGIWSILLAIVIVFLASRLRFVETIAVTWVTCFVFMWMVIGNLGVLPWKLLIAAVPLSILEVVLATVIAYLVTGNPIKARVS